MLEQAEGFFARHGAAEVEALDLVAAQIADQLGFFRAFNYASSLFILAVVAEFLPFNGSKK